MNYIIFKTKYKTKQKKKKNHSPKWNQQCNHEELPLESIKCYHHERLYNKYVYNNTSINLLTLCLFRWKTFCKDSFSYFPVFESIKKWVKGKLSLVNRKKKKKKKYDLFLVIVFHYFFFWKTILSYKKLNKRS